MWPMKILIYGINFRPELTGVGKYTGEMADWLVAQGHDVRVITAPPYYPQWRVLPGFRQWKYSREDTRMLKGTLGIFRCPLWIPKNPSSRRRILHLLSFCVSSLPILFWQTFWRPQILIVLEPTIACAPQALFYAFLSRCKTWLHVQDLEFDTAFSLNMIRNGLLKSLLSSVERLIMRKFTFVSTISKKMLERLRGKGVIGSQSDLFPNWVDTNLIFPIESVSTLRNEFGIPETSIVLLYSGNLGRKQGLNVLVSAAKVFQSRSNVLFLICGEGSYREELRWMMEGLPNVRFMNLQPFDRLNQLLNTADVHLLPQEIGVADLVMPSKLGGMMASGKPIVSIAEEGTQLALSIQHCGISARDESEFIEGIRTLIDDAPRRAEMGKNARRYAIHNLDKDLILKNFEHDLMLVARKEHDAKTVNS
jgi:colanic acid biosynthesis glycosyl transferase WcaI